MVQAAHLLALSNTGKRDGGPSALDIWTLVIAAFSLGVAVIGTCLAYSRARASDRTAQASNGVAREALQDARDARRDAKVQSAWSRAIESVQRLLGFDLTESEPTDRWQDLRIAFTELVDVVEDMDELGSWLHEERRLGIGLARLAQESAEPGDSEERRLVLVAPVGQWGSNLVNNLRFLRLNGYDADELAHARVSAAKQREAIYESQGWNKPPTDS